MSDRKSRTYYLHAAVVSTLVLVLYQPVSGYKAVLPSMDSVFLPSRMRAAGNAPEIVIPIHLPLILRGGMPTPILNAPFFDESVRFPEAAIAWFGEVNESSNYADIRVGYNSQELKVRLQIFDHYLWYDRDPEPGSLTEWDAVSLYLDLRGNRDSKLGAGSYRFDGQLVWWEERDAYQASYQGDKGFWELTSIPFTTRSGWRGNAPNDSEGDRGWRITFTVPFSSLGLSGRPVDGTTWGMAIALRDRDSAEGPPNPVTTWPEEGAPPNPASWGTLRFGLESGLSQMQEQAETITIRHGLNGAVVRDAMVGGSTNCGSGLDYWAEWGDANYAGINYLNVQNQADISDWPCFSKVYITFLLDMIPVGREITSAHLTLHQMGNAGGGEWGPSPDSLIQVLTIGENWSEETITWNNAPLAVENVSQAWVKPIENWPGWPGVPWTWDVTSAAAEAYATGIPLRLVLYSSDNDYNSGKYFASSDVDDWNEIARPTLVIGLRDE